jgi:hypothetical protein
MESDIMQETQTARLKAGWQYVAIMKIVNVNSRLIDERP